jgi:hypothetical protein
VIVGAYACSRGHARAGRRPSPTVAQNCRMRLP